MGGGSTKVNGKKLLLNLNGVFQSSLKMQMVCLNPCCPNRILDGCGGGANFNSWCVTNKY